MTAEPWEPCVSINGYDRWHRPVKSGSRVRVQYETDTLFEGAPGRWFWLGWLTTNRFGQPDKVEPVDSLEAGKAAADAWLREQGLL